MLKRGLIVLLSLFVFTTVCGCNGDANDDAPVGGTSALTDNGGATAAGNAITSGTPANNDNGNNTVVGGSGASGKTPECGNGVLETGENCEVGLPLALNCKAMGYVGGDLACNLSTCLYDASGCIGKDTGQAGADEGAAGSDIGAGGTDGDGTGDVLPPVGDIDPQNPAEGPFETMYDLNDGPRGGSGVFRPVDLGRDGVKHPIFVWGCGGGTAPNSYIDHMSLIASHGFVVVAEVSSGSGTELTAALDWLEQENERQGSDFYQKLDLSRMAAGGHSMGSITSYAMGNDPRLATTVQVCGGSFDGRGSLNLHAPVVMFGGDGDIGTPQFETDYQVVTVPAVFLVKDNTEHIMCAREHLGPWIEWLRWHLADETFRRAHFLDPNCLYCQPPWNGQNKNW